MTRREWLLAGALLAVGIALRLWVADRSAVEHFDEGVYSSNLFFADPPYSYPMQHLYAPPLLPSLIEAGMIAGLPANLAAILPGLIAGCLTLVVVWRMARRWFGPAAGLASLTLAALSDFHVAYSSTALTDVLLTLFVLLAVAATGRALAWAVHDRPESLKESPALSPPKATAPKRRGRRSAEHQPAFDGSTVVSRGGNLVDKWAVIAGLLTAAAWWTKYNGWLPLAIAIASTGLLLLVAPAARASWRRLAFVIVLIVVVAAIAWSPVPLGLSDVGGYSAVSANHATYVVGPAGWIGGALRQIANQSAMEGVLSWVSLSVAILAGWYVLAPTSSEKKSTGPRLSAVYLVGGMVLLTLVAIVESTFVVLLVVALASVIAYASDYLRRPGERRLAESTIGTCLLAAWLFGLLLATPNYWPYPRLVMPLLASLWLVAGYGISRLIRKTDESADTSARTSMRPRQLAMAIVIGLAAALPAVYFGRAPVDSLTGSLGTDRTGMAQAARTIAAQIADDLQQNQEEPICIIFVQAEPALVFQLRAAGFPLVQPVVGPPESPVTIQGRQIPTYYVFGPHAGRDKQFATEWPSQKSGFSQLDSSSIETRPSKVVWLDSNDPRRTRQKAEPITVLRRN